jgi:hypothetical protein
MIILQLHCSSDLESIDPNRRGDWLERTDQPEMRSSQSIFVGIDPGSIPAVKELAIKIV